MILKTQSDYTTKLSHYLGWAVCYENNISGSLSIHFSWGTPTRKLIEDQRHKLPGGLGAQEAVSKQKKKLENGTKSKLDSINCKYVIHRKLFNHLVNMVHTYTFLAR